MDNLDIKQLEKKMKALKRDAAVLKRLSAEKSKQAFAYKVKINNIKLSERAE